MKKKKPTNPNILAAAILPTEARFKNPSPKMLKPQVGNAMAQPKAPATSKMGGSGRIPKGSNPKPISMKMLSMPKNKSANPFPKLSGQAAVFKKA